MAKFTGIKGEGRGREVHTDGEEVLWWQLLFSYKGIRKTIFIVRDTTGSESSLSSEADCLSVL